MTPNPEFCAAVQRPVMDIDLAQAALLYARDAYPDLDPALYLNQLDEWAEDIRSDIVRSIDPIATLNRFLFDDLHFQGNRRFYGDPRNSYLNEVIDRRLGLPITLSVLYIEVARRVGLRVEGVGLPGHFIVRHLDRTGARYIDPFHQGRLLTPADCRNLVVDLSNGVLEFQPAMLEPVDAQHILTRMLNNLKNAYVQEQRFDRAVNVVERLLDLSPHEPSHLRDLGLLHYQLDHYGPALQALKRYLSIVNAPADDPVQQVIVHLQVQIARLN
jgi:regulator of sirC expression with transglutaminase-like and TPR domain